MFNTMKSTLFEVPEKGNSSGSVFVDAAKKPPLKKVLSGNGAVKYASTGNAFVDQFGTLGSYREIRPFEKIAADNAALMAIDKRLAVMFIIYLRVITRVISFFDGTKTETVQRGAGLRHESIMRMIHLHTQYPDIFWKNITLFIAAGSLKDIITMLQYDLMYHGWENRKLNWERFGDLLVAGLENPSVNNLIKKYLPQIKAKSKCTTVASQADTMIGKWIANRLSLSYAQYRKLKTSGTAHEWQKLISQKRLLEINFNTVHGRALALLVSGKFIKNNNLEERYTKWILAQPVAKYTGYVHELFTKVSATMPVFLKHTVNKQFDGLVETGMKNAVTNTRLIVVRDTSSSMGSTCTGLKVSCNYVAKALALYFSAFLQGSFKNAWIEFNSSAKMHTWVGTNAVDKWLNDNASYIGGTDFQSVIRLFIEIKEKGIDEKDFPTGILCISDSEFNPTSTGDTNVNKALSALRQAGFSEEYVSNFKIILWNLQSNYYGDTTGKKFEGGAGKKNVFYFSGFDGATVAFLTGVETKEPQKAVETAEDLFNAAMNQEILSRVEV